MKRAVDRVLAVSTWLRLLHAYGVVERELRRAVAVHCTFPQFDVLNQLDREPGGLTFVELSRRLLVTAGNLTGIVDRLQDERLVRRTVHPDDRRAFRLTLTAKGRRLIRRAQQRHHRALAALLGDVTQHDLRTLRRLLGRLRTSASARVGKAGTKR
ncbi:MAG: MarR family transcriptional regulator [Candidatus Rokuibacteriota bacterium]|nr:MAG: MarR family transcriptional regulator [Candidatus Rokubacteria bacterium]